MQFRNLFIYLFILVIGISVGLFSVILINEHRDSKVLSAKEEKCPYDYLNPLRCDPENSIKVKEYTALRNELVEYINSQEDEKKTTKVSVFFRDLVSGSTMSIDSQEAFAPASLLKVPLLITYYKKAETDPNILNQRFKVSGNINTLKQNIKPEKTVELGKLYSIQELLDLMITQSDNGAWEVLLAYLRQSLSEEDFVGTLSDLGIIDPRKKHDEQYVTTQSYAAIFRILFNGSYLNLEMSNKALDLMSRTVFKDGIVAGVPEETKVSHKFGERKNGDDIQLHDCGIIYFEKNPYLLCVMTRGEKLDNLKPIIAEISKMVYEEVSSRN